MPKNQKRTLVRGQSIKIILTGGGSGGHITPLLPLARALKAKNPRSTIIYIGLKGDKIALQAQYGAFDVVCYITSGKFRRYHGESILTHLVDVKTLMLNFRDLFKVFFGTLSSLRLLEKYKPDVVFSKGGYVVVPVGLAAHLRGVPIITHDSDAAAGLANRIVGRWAKVHTTAMAPKYYPSYPSGSIKQVGIPVDEHLKPVDEAGQKNLKRQIGLSPDGLMLLVAGGGLGSQTINRLMAQLSPQLLKDNPSLEIVHFSGSGHQEAVAEHYYRQLGKAMPSRVKVLGFSSDFYAYNGAADLVLARAGATTIAELAAVHKAAVIIPSPFLTGGHQLKNAEELTTHGAAVVLPNDVTEQKLLATLNDLLQNKRRRQQLADRIGLLARPDAAAKLADILLEATKT